MRRQYKDWEDWAKNALVHQKEMAQKRRLRELQALQHNYAPTIKSTLHHQKLMTAKRAAKKRLAKQIAEAQAAREERKLKRAEREKNIPVPKRYLGK